MNCHCLLLLVLIGLGGCRIPLSKLSGDPGKPVSEPGSASAVLTPGEIQGPGHLSPFEGTFAEGVQGIVTAAGSEGFWIQKDGKEPGVYVFSPAAERPPAGNFVSVDGLIGEFREEAGALSVTEISVSGDDGHVTVLASNRDLPEPLLLGSIGAPWPTHDQDDSVCPDGPEVSLSPWNPEEDIIDFWESLEGRRVTLESAVATGGMKHGLVPLSPEGDNQLLILMDLSKREDSSWERAVKGDRLSTPVTGVIHYQWGEYRLIPDKVPDLLPGGRVQEVSSLPTEENTLRLATFNVENFSVLSPGLTGDELEAKLDGLADIIARNLNCPDIIALQEVMDDSGERDDGTIGGWQNFTSLADRLSEESGEAYLFCSCDPVDGEDGGKGGANIRTGFLYNRERVLLTGPAERLGEENFAACRKPLSARFRFAGRSLELINCHLSSRRGDSPFMGEYQPPRLSSEEKRLPQAQALRDYIDGRRREDGETGFIILGDMNDYPDSAVLNLLGEGGPDRLVSLTDKLPGEDRYSYIYNGRANQLDHILVSPELAAEGSAAEILHVCAAWSDGDRCSDHDPVVVSLPLSPLPSPDPAPGGLIFSDYGEGSGYNKYLELANLTERTIRQEEFFLLYCANGALPPEGKVIPLTADIPAGCLAGFHHSRSDAISAIPGSEADCPSFNGNDALLLVKDENETGFYEPEEDSLTDCLGFPGDTTDWAKDLGLRREAFVNRGSADYRREEWIPYAPDRVDRGEFYGTHFSNRGELSF